MKKVCHDDHPGAKLFTVFVLPPPAPPKYNVEESRPQEIDLASTLINIVFGGSGGLHGSCKNCKYFCTVVFEKGYNF